MAFSYTGLNPQLIPRFYPAGGYAVIVMRAEHLLTVDDYKLHFRATLDKLVNEGKP